MWGKVENLETLSSCLKCFYAWGCVFRTKKGFDQDSIWSNFFSDPRWNVFEKIQNKITQKQNLISLLISREEKNGNKRELSLD